MIIIALLNEKWNKTPSVKRGSPAIRAFPCISRPLRPLGSNLIERWFALISDAIPSDAGIQPNQPLIRPASRSVLMP